jgi:hypothetical protein
LDVELEFGWAKLVLFLENDWIFIFFLEVDRQISISDFFLLLFEHLIIL